LVTPNDAKFQENSQPQETFLQHSPILSTAPYSHYHAGHRPTAQISPGVACFCPNSATERCQTKRIYTKKAKTFRFSLFVPPQGVAFIASGGIVAGIFISNSPLTHTVF